MRRLLYLILISFTILFMGCISNNMNFNTKEKSIVVYSSLKELDMPKDNISIWVNGNPLDLESSIYLSKNRYYLCLNETVDKLNGSIDIQNNILNINLLNTTFTIDTESNIVSVNNSDSFILKNSLISNDNCYYIDFSDLSHILNMYTHWDKTTKTIYCNTTNEVLNNINPYKSSIDTLGFLRLEDIELTKASYDVDYFEKIRVISDYLYKKNIPFNIAWIPKEVNPACNIVNDPILCNDFINAEQVYSLDYFINHNGSIGLHGYTHQFGNETSGVGSEFGIVNPSISDFKDRMNKAIETANYLNIPISFFEAPHYEITKEQTIEAEKLFKVLYYPYYFDGKEKLDSTKPQISPNNKSCYYIDTPLDYISIDNVSGSLKRIENTDIKNMGSVFYHPRLEFQNITLTLENNIPSYKYNIDSTLEKLLAILEKKGYKFSKIDDIQ